MENGPLKALRHHVTGAIERGEKTAIVEQRSVGHTQGLIEGIENLYFGKWRVRRTDGSRVGEMFGNEIRAELRDEWKRKLKTTRRPL